MSHPAGIIGGHGRRARLLGPTTALAAGLLAAGRVGMERAGYRARCRQGTPDTDPTRRIPDSRVRRDPMASMDGRRPRFSFHGLALAPFGGERPWIHTLSKAREDRPGRGRRAGSHAWRRGPSNPLVTGERSHDDPVCPDDDSGAFIHRFVWVVARASARQGGRRRITPEADHSSSTCSHGRSHPVFGPTQERTDALVP